LISDALAGLKNLWLHEPLRIIWLASNAGLTLYDSLNGGVSLENALFAVGTFLVTELGRRSVYAPATVAKLQ